MTRKDYIALAGAIKAARLPATVEGVYPAPFNDGISSAAEQIADTLAQDNPRFDRARFLKACGV